MITCAILFLAGVIAMAIVHINDRWVKPQHRMPATPAEMLLGLGMLTILLCGTAMSIWTLLGAR